MECYICYPETNDAGECESCRYDLRPLQEYMREHTGDASFTDHAALSAVDKSDAAVINAWCAGAQLPYEVIRKGEKYQVARIQLPRSSFATHADQRIAELEREQPDIESLITEKDIKRAAEAIQGRGEYEDAEALVMRVISALGEDK